MREYFDSCPWCGSNAIGCVLVGIAAVEWRCVLCPAVWMTDRYTGGLLLVREPRGILPVWATARIG